MTKLLLIDGHSLAYRAFHGSAHSGNLLMTSSGVPTNALLTFHRMLMRIIKRYQPTHVLVAFDASKKTRRHELLATYKAGRATTPPELIAQFPLIKEMLKLMAITTLELEGIEADDIIATTTHFPADKVFVISTDRDLLQLVNEHVSVVIPQMGNKDDIVVENTNFMGLFGYLPHQVPDIKALMGDASDNLPGVKGIGPKTACQLIASYRDLDGVYSNLSAHSSTIGARLTADRDTAFLCRQLATLDVNIVLPFEIKSLAYEYIISPDLMAFFEKYELKSLLDKYRNDALDDRKTFNKISF